ncbi:HNH endonuclease [Clostridioides difficile]|nr:HNH endonuclease [Clostridioides difficile]
MKLKKICRCGKTIDYSEKACSECAKKYVKSKKQSNKVYNSKNRNKERDKFYNTKEWRETREYILEKNMYLDLWDYYINKKITTANTVHHIIELSEDEELSLEENNLVPLSSKTHKKIHTLYEKNEITKKETQSKLKEILRLHKMYNE